MSRLVQNQRQNLPNDRSGEVLMLSHGNEVLNRAVRLNYIELIVQTKMGGYDKETAKKLLGSVHLETCLLPKWFIFVFGKAQV